MIVLKCLKKCVAVDMDILIIYVYLFMDVCLVLQSSIIYVWVLSHLGLFRQQRRVTAV